VLSGDPRWVVVGRALPDQGADKVFLIEYLIEDQAQAEQLNIVDADEDHAAVVVQHLP